MLKRFHASLLTLLAAASWAVAQLPGGMQIPTVTHNPALLMNPQVRQELKLSPAVAQKAQQVIMDEGMAMLPLLSAGQNGSKPMPQEKKMKLIFAAYGRMESKTLALLTPPQRTRLKEITLQSIGAVAALQPSVAQELGLNSAQKTKFSTAISAAQTKAYSSVSAGQTGSNLQSQMSQFAAKQAALKATTDRALMSVLTPAQKAKWNKMLGKRIALTGAFGMGGIAGM